jgi:hypothetical protein
MRNHSTAVLFLASAFTVGALMACGEGGASSPGAQAPTGNVTSVATTEPPAGAAGAAGDEDPNHPGHKKAGGSHGAQQGAAAEPAPASPKDVPPPLMKTPTPGPTNTGDPAPRPGR